MDRTGWHLFFVTKDTPKPDQRRKYNAAFRAEALRLAAQSRSAQAATRALNIGPKRIWTVAEGGPNARRGHIGGGAGPDHGGRTAPTAGPGPAASAATGDFRKSHCRCLLHAQALTDAGPISRYRFIEAERSQYPVR